MTTKTKTNPTLQQLKEGTVSKFARDIIRMAVSFNNPPPSWTVKNNEEWLANRSFEIAEQQLSLAYQSGVRKTVEEVEKGLAITIREYPELKTAVKSVLYDHLSKKTEKI